MEKITEGRVAVNGFDKNNKKVDLLLMPPCCYRQKQEKKQAGKAAFRIWFKGAQNNSRGAEIISDGY